MFYSELCLDATFKLSYINVIIIILDECTFVTFVSRFHFFFFAFIYSCYASAFSKPCVFVMLMRLHTSKRRSGTAKINFSMKKEKYVK